MNHLDDNASYSSSSITPEERRIVFAHRLRSRMDFLGLTQADLATRSNITHPAIHYYLRANRAPKAVELHKLAESLGTTMDWLWGANTSAPPPSADRSKEIYIDQQVYQLTKQLEQAMHTVASIASPPRQIAHGNSTIINAGDGANITVTPPDNPKP